MNYKPYKNMNKSLGPIAGRMTSTMSRLEKLQCLAAMRGVLNDDSEVQEIDASLVKYMAIVTSLYLSKTLSKADKK
jgi:hypothetical protein